MSSSRGVVNVAVDAGQDALDDAVLIVSVLYQPTLCGIGDEADLDQYGWHLRAHEDIEGGLFDSQVLAAMPRLIQR